MNDLNAVLRAVLANPASDDPRLMYADLLLEQGDVRIKCPRCDGTGNEDAQKIPDDPLLCRLCNGLNHGTVLDTSNRARAEFIKVQIELARITEPRKCEKTFCDGSLVVCEECREWKRLNKREREIAAPGASHSWATLPGAFVPKLASGGTVRNGTSGTFAFFRRGFIETINCTVETFLKHEAALIWHPTQTVGCDHPNCVEGRWTNWTLWPNCEKCNGSGRLPRPCPDTAQPITKVTLTSCADWDSFCLENEFKVLNTTGRRGDGKWTSQKWPGIQFDLE